MSSWSSTDSNLNPATPPRELRTDPERGTGELGTEGVDQSQSLQIPRHGSPRWGLYGSKDGASWRLVATFDTFEQLRAYVRWATLQVTGPQSGKFEPGSALAGHSYWRESSGIAEDNAADVFHNPSPSML